MAKRKGNALWGQSIKRTLTAMTRTALRASSKAMTQALKTTPGKRKPKPVKKTQPTSTTPWITGVAVGTAGVRRYRLFKPPGVRSTERLPLLVMLHGCGQDAEALAASTHMNRLAVRERFLVLYPEQDRMSNMQGCWNWYETRTGRAQGEADTINAAIDQVCQMQAVDPARIGLAGISAGAGIAALLATRHPQRFRAIAMHSGIAPGLAHSSATALRAMRGYGLRAVPLTPLLAGTRLPALLVIQGSLDAIVASSNGADAARWWAAHEGAKPGASRTVQRGARYASTITDYRSRGQLIATLCEIKGLGHAWSGGGAGQAYSDPKGPDASRMIWSFMAKQFVRPPL
ncbi:MAG: alpha/beta fold hydrolase [Pseudomonadota bacterium]